MATFFIFADHVEHTADQMPHENRVCLPSCQTKKEIYALYVQDIHNAKGETLSLASFKRMWRQYFRHVIIPKVRQEFCYLELDMQ